MENVKNLLSSKHKEHFDLWCEYLESKGYKNFYKVMDSSDYGIAQHRERVFMISILGDYRYEFPKEIPLDNCMKDYLDEVVEDKYYITSEKARTLIDKLILDGKILAEQSRAEQSRAEQLNCQSSQNKLIQQTASWQEKTEEYQESPVKEQELLRLPSYLNYNKVDKVDCQIARTLDTRCCTMGTSNQTQNGVIECKKL